MCHHAGQLVLSGPIGQRPGTGLNVLDRPVFLSDGCLVELVDAQIARVEVEDASGGFIVHFVSEARSSALLQTHTLSLWRGLM